MDLKGLDRDWRKQRSYIRVDTYPLLSDQQRVQELIWNCVVLSTVHTLLQIHRHTQVMLLLPLTSRNGGELRVGGVWETHGEGRAETRSWVGRRGPAVGPLPSCPGRSLSPVRLGEGTFRLCSSTPHRRQQPHLRETGEGRGLETWPDVTLTRQV